MSESVLQERVVPRAWIEPLYDRVVEGAWRIAMRATGDEAAASSLVDAAFREHMDDCGSDDPVCVLRHVLARANAHRARAAHVDVDRRASLDIRDAFELVYVGGARLDDVARAFECTVSELSHRLLDAVRPAATTAPA